MHVFLCPRCPPPSTSTPRNLPFLWKPIVRCPDCALGPLSTRLSWSVPHGCISRLPCPPVSGWACGRHQQETSSWGFTTQAPSWASGLNSYGAPPLQAAALSGAPWLVPCSAPSGQEWYQHPTAARPVCHCDQLANSARTPVGIFLNSQLNPLSMPSASCWILDDTSVTWGFAFLLAPMQILESGLFPCHSACTPHTAVIHLHLVFLMFPKHIANPCGLSYWAYRVHSLGKVPCSISVYRWKLQQNVLKNHLIL